MELGLAPLPVHNPRDIPGKGLTGPALERLQSTFGARERSAHKASLFPPPPDHIFLQLHWYREPNLQDYLAQYRFKIITLARHPLDVLVSAWRFRRFHPDSHLWLGGNAKLPFDHLHDPPCSDAFQSYACSFGAENLLCVSYQWWHDLAVITLRYEDVVAHGLRAFEDICLKLGHEPRRLQQAFEKFNLGYFQLENQHGWQGRPGIWRDLIVADDARAIFERHRQVFEALGYGVDPHGTLSPAEARSNWERLNEGEQTEGT
jgi:hypothetical protein